MIFAEMFCAPGSFVWLPRHRKRVFASESVVPHVLPICADTIDFLVFKPFLKCMDMAVGPLRPMWNQNSCVCLVTSELFEPVQIQVFSPCDSVGPAPHEAIPVVWIKSMGVLHRITQRLSYPETEDILPIPFQRSPSGCALSLQDDYDRCPHQGHMIFGVRKGALCDWHINCLDMILFLTLKEFLSILKGYVSQDRHVHGVLPESSGRIALLPPIQAGERDPPVATDSFCPSGWFISWVAWIWGWICSRGEGWSPRSGGYNLKW